MRPSAHADGVQRSLPYPATRRTVAPRTVLAVASFGAFLAFLDATIVNVALPDIADSFEGSSIPSLSWILNAYNLVFAAFLVPAGRLVDLLGRKRLFEGGIVLFVVGSVLCAVAPSVGFLIGARCVQALGAAVVVPASLALVLHAFGAEGRAKAVAMWGAVAALAAGLGPSIGGVLIEIADWRLVFVVNLPIGIAAVVMSRRTLVESRAPGRRTTPDLYGAVLLTVAVGLLTLGIVQGDAWGWTSVQVLGAFALALAAGVWVVHRCTWHASPVLPLALLRGRAIGAANALTLVASTGFYAYLLANVLFLTSVWGYSVLQAGLALTPGPLVAAVVAAPLGRYLERHDHRWVVVPGALVWAAGVTMLITRLGTTPDFVTGWLPAIIVLGVGAGATLPALGTTAITAAPEGRFATATAANSVARQLGAVLGVALLVAIVGTPAPADLPAAFDSGWTFAAICFVLVAIAAPLMAAVAHPSTESREEARADGALASAIASVSPAAVDQPRAASTSSDPADILATVSIFAPLDHELRREVADRARIIRVQGGDWLFRIGEPGDALYVVLAGRCEVVDAQDQAIVVLGRGAVLGELALITGAPRAASVRASRDTELLELTHAEFERLLTEEPTFAAALTSELGRQLAVSRPVTPPSPNRGAILAVVALSPDVDAENVAGALVERLGRWERVARIDRLPPDQLERASSVLDELEHRYDRVVMVPGSDADRRWTDIALRQADRVIALVGGGPAAGRGDGTGNLQGCDLVFCDGAVTARTTAAWMAALAPRATYRLREAAFADDVGRLARRLAGRAPGLVLSGGGARALAHVGVIDELWRSGVRFDRVAGVSMGSFVAALLASGATPGEIDACAYEEWVRRSPLSDYRLPRISLLRGHRARDMFARVLPGRIETLPLDFFCVSCDLVSGRQVVHRSGSLAFAVSASASLPGMFPPVAGPDGTLLVDGGITSNLPVDLMAATAEGPVIAVDVSKKFDPPSADTHPRLRNLLHTRAVEEWPWDDDRTLPTITETLTRLVMVGSQDVGEAAREHADLLITPVNDAVGLLEFHQLDAMHDAGRRAAREALGAAAPELRARLSAD